MKSLMIAGGLGGFLLAMVLGLMVRSPWPVVLLHASLAAAACGIALRWWGRVWIRNYHQALLQRQAAAVTTPPAKTAPPRRP